MKRSIGFYGSLAAAAVGAAGVAAYVVNAGTNYFKGLGMDAVVIGGMIVGIAALLVWAFLGEEKTTWKDILPIVAPAAMIYAMIMLTNSRINGIAAIMTFENNAKNQADLKSAIVAMALMILAAILAAITAFFSVKKDTDAGASSEETGAVQQ